MKKIIVFATLLLGMTSVCFAQKNYKDAIYGNTQKHSAAYYGLDLTYGYYVFARGVVGYRILPYLEAGAAVGLNSPSISYVEGLLALSLPVGLYVSSNLMPKALVSPYISFGAGYSVPLWHDEMDGFFFEPAFGVSIKYSQESRIYMALSGMALDYECFLCLKTGITF